MIFMDLSKPSSSMLSLSRPLTYRNIEFFDFYYIDFHGPDVIFFADDHQPTGW